MRKVWIVIVVLLLAAVFYELIVIAVFAVDFSSSVIPGWHTTVHPRWLIGAIFISLVMMVFMIIRLILVLTRKNK